MLSSTRNREVHMDGSLPNIPIQEPCEHDKIGLVVQCGICCGLPTIE
jgi:hypothetical protein